MDADKAGNRNWVQVLSNSLPSLMAAVAYRVLLRDTRPLIFAALGHFSTAMADTLASEMGILSASPPRSILSLRPVPPGTNGGVSWTGIRYSLIGGAVMGLVMALDLYVEAGRADTLELVVFGSVAGLAGSLVCPVEAELIIARLVTGGDDAKDGDPAEWQGADGSLDSRSRGEAGRSGKGCVVEFGRQCGVWVRHDRGGVLVWHSLGHGCEH